MGRDRMLAIVLAAFVASWISPPGAGAQESAPRENLMKVCGDKWRAIREAQTANGVTWPQFLARCRVDAASLSAPAAPASPAAPADPTPAVASPKPTPQPRAGSRGPVFPDVVSSRHASERPALGRQRTCADQFKVNKAGDANGGLRWIEKGGGYWSLCNAHLKQARA